MLIVIKLYSLINNLLEIIGFKLDYIGSYRYRWMKSLSLTNLIDIGANKGQTISKYKKIWNNELNIYSFEPLSKAYSILSSKYGNDPKVHLYNMGLGNKKEELEINIFSNDDSSSILSAADNGKRIYNYKVNGNETINIETLDSFYNIITPGLSLMKIDVQGYELNVLQGGELFICKNVKIIILELSFIELYKGQQLFDEIYSRLKDKGFKYSGSLEQAGDPSNGKPIQQDAIFLNTNL